MRKGWGIESSVGILTGMSNTSVDKDRAGEVQRTIPTEALRLEALLVELRTCSQHSLDIEMYERFGHATEQQLDEYAKQLGYSPSRAWALRSELETLVADCRKNHPKALEYWISAHIELLREQICRHQDDPENQHSTTISVATYTIGYWEKVRAGSLAFVEENIPYLSNKAELYSTLFGSQGDGP